MKTPQQSLGCLTEMHTNTAIREGSRLYGVAVENSLLNKYKALCCYVKVSACNCTGCFEAFIIYIFVCISKSAQATVPAGRKGVGRWMSVSYTSEVSHFSTGPQNQGVAVATAL